LLKQIFGLAPRFIGRMKNCNFDVVGLTRPVIRELTYVAFAHRASSFTQEALTFQVLLTNRAVEALAVIIVIHRLNPAITSFYGETTSETLSRKQFIPVCKV